MLPYLKTFWNVSWSSAGGWKPCCMAASRRAGQSAVGQFDAARAAFRAQVAGHAHPQRGTGQHLVQVSRGRLQDQFSRRKLHGVAQRAACRAHAALHAAQRRLAVAGLAQLFQQFRALRGFDRGHRCSPTYVKSARLDHAAMVPGERTGGEGLLLGGRVKQLVCLVQRCSPDFAEAVIVQRVAVNRPEQVVPAFEAVCGIPLRLAGIRQGRRHFTQCENGHIKWRIRFNRMGAIRQ